MTVRVIYPGSIYDRNGATKVVKVFADYGDLLKKFSGHEIHVTDLSSVSSNSANNSNLNVGNTSVSDKLKQTAKRILGDRIMHRYAKTYLGTVRHVEYIYWRRGYRILEKYHSLDCHDDAFIFHDLFSCWAYVHDCIANHLPICKFILILHSCGEDFKMTFISYPNLKGTAYHRKMNIRMDTCLKHAGFIVFVSEMSSETFKTLHPIYANKVKVIRNGINSEVFLQNLYLMGNLE